jgi:RNA ligase
MVTYLWDVLDPWHLQQMVDEGYVRVQTHPSLPYKIACYTKKAMFDREWNDTTKVCRGLIWHDSGRIEGRPFAKFFNYGEPDAPELKPSTQVIAFDKLDGSLGISYMTPDGPAIATKGSFASEQALHATELLRTKYGSWAPLEGHTALYEIIYPENRIVLDYGDEDKLVLLGIVNNQTGKSWGWEGVEIIDPPFETAPVLGIGPLADVLKFPDRPNREGMVLKVLNKDIRIKVKQQDYLELHKVMTGLNERQIWEWFASKHNVDEVLVDLPEELHEWVTKVWKDLGNRFDELSNEVIECFFEHGFNTTRKDFATAIKDEPKWKQGALWARYDGNFERVGEIVWKQLKP